MLFNKEIIYLESIWSNLEQQNPVLIGQITTKFKDEVLKQHYKRLQFEALHPKAKFKNAFDSSEMPTPIKFNKNDSNLNLKDFKPLDGFESEWKEGKMKPVDQKSYRSKFDEQ
jgi:hypothetical protein